jgi:hypothetical protein
MKFRPVGAELFHADRQTDVQRETVMTKLTAGFHNFANVPKNDKTLHIGMYSRAESRIVISLKRPQSLKFLKFVALNHLLSGC